MTITDANSPQRIQLKRTRDWNLQELSQFINGLPAVVVSRPGPLGNPMTIKAAIEAGYARKDKPDDAQKFVVECFRDWLLQTPGERDWWSGRESDARRAAIMKRLPELRGKNLACWCREGTPCHADVLLELANGDYILDVSETGNG